MIFNGQDSSSSSSSAFAAVLDNDYVEPMQEVRPEDVDALLAKELNQMSIEERELIYEEVHGVDKIIEETPEFVQEKLDALEVAIQEIKEKPAYQLAEQISIEYVTNPKFRLMFLRAERFDARLAAIRLVKFMEGKLEFFGAETLTRQVFLSDLGHEEIEIVKSGRLQVLPSRDRNGRTVIADIKMEQMPFYSSVDSLLRAFLYLLMTVSEDEETQKRGLVGIYYFSVTLELARDLQRRKARIMDWIPLRYSGAHLCSNDQRLLALKALLMLAIGKSRRSRLRLHEGTHTECQYSLMAFGIPVSALPVTYEGEVKLAAHAKWIAKRMTKEEQLRKGKEFHGIDLPGLNDVLLGRGKTVQDHCGNLKMRYIIELYMEEYKHAPKLSKSDVALQVVQQVKKHGGKFLKREKNGWWVEVSDEAAREKVSMTFRTSITSFKTEKGRNSAVSLLTVNPDACSQKSKRAKIMFEEKNGGSCFSIPIFFN